MSTGSHNKFIFDFDNRSFVGDFEKMYQSEKKEGFDSWQQDQMSKYKKIDLVILDEYNFKTILDIGCGKGFFTSLLKKKNNIVAGVDISQRAVEIARQKYPELMFSQLDVNKSNALDEFCHEFMAGGVDIIIARAILYYLQNWKDVLYSISKNAKYAYVGLNIPDDTILFIKNKNEFINEFEKYFQVVDYIEYVHEHSFVILGETRQLVQE